MTDEMRAAIRAAWPSVEYLTDLRTGAIAYWSDGDPPTAAELDAALVAYQASQAEDTQERTQLQAARDTLIAYRDAAAPTPAQTAAVVRLLCRIALRWLRQM